MRPRKASETQTTAAHTCSLQSWQAPGLNGATRHHYSIPCLDTHVCTVSYLFITTECVPSPQQSSRQPSLLSAHFAMRMHAARLQKCEAHSQA